MSTIVQRTRVAAVSVTSTGSLAVLSNRYCKGTVTIHRLDEDGQEETAYYVETERQETDGAADFNQALFPILPVGNYGVSRPGASYAAKKVTVFPGQVTQVDFR